MSTKTDKILESLKELSLLEASELVKAYPLIQWTSIGMPTLRFALLTCLFATAIGGVLSNPLFKWANNAVAGTPIFQDALAFASNQGSLG